MVDIEKMYPIVNDWGWVTHFENTIAKYCGSHCALAVDSNTNAIKLVLEYLNIKNKTIFVPKNTYVSVPSQIIHSGNTPHFVDFEWEGEYQLYPYPIWDSATRFRKNMHTLKTYQINHSQEIDITKFKNYPLNIKKNIAREDICIDKYGSKIVYKTYKYI